MVRAASALRQAAHRTGDRRLLALAKFAELAASWRKQAEQASRLVADPSAKDKFKPVLASIDKMLKTLADDEKKDLETKENCEADRMKDTRKALVSGKDMDEETDSITQLESEIKDLKTEIAKLLDQKAQVKKELDDATKIRDDENKQW